jgi:hypothetical protein
LVELNEEKVRGRRFGSRRAALCVHAGSQHGPSLSIGTTGINRGRSGPIVEILECNSSEADDENRRTRSERVHSLVNIREKNVHCPLVHRKSTSYAQAFHRC